MDQFAYTTVSFLNSNFSFSKHLLEEGDAKNNQEMNKLAKEKMDALQSANMKCIDVLKTENYTQYTYKIPANMADKF